MLTANIFNGVELLSSNKKEIAESQSDGEGGGRVCKHG